MQKCLCAFAWGHFVMVIANSNDTFLCAVFTKLFAALDKQRCILYTNS